MLLKTERCRLQVYCNWIQVGGGHFRRMMGRDCRTSACVVSVGCRCCFCITICPICRPPTIRFSQWSNDFALVSISPVTQHDDEANNYTLVQYCNLDFTRFEIFKNTRSKYSQRRLVTEAGTNVAEGARFEIVSVVGNLEASSDHIVSRQQLSKSSVEVNFIEIYCK